MRLRFALLLMTGAIQASGARAAELHVVSSGGFAEAYRTLLPGFEAATGHHVTTEWGPSMGATPQAVPQRLARHEPIDVVIMVGTALEGMVQRGQAAGSTDLARSVIGVVVKAGAPVPDISTPEALTRALLAAKSVAVSDSASGVYIMTVMFKRLGIEAAMARTARVIPAEPVGAVVARGEAEIGFQQVSELRPIQGIILVGPLPNAVQQVTLFSAGRLTTSQNAGAADALIAYLARPEAAPAIIESGLDPVNR